MDEKMDLQTLELAHGEILRLRERQVARTSSIRARSTGVLGAPGLAASLVSAVGTNGWYALAIGCFVFATIYAVKSMAALRVLVMHPVGVIQRLVGKDAYDARVELIKQVRTEYDRAEDGLREVVKHTSTATGWFVAGAVMLFVVSALHPLIEAFGERG